MKSAQYLKLFFNGFKRPFELLEIPLIMVGMIVAGLTFAAIIYWDIKRLLDIAHG